MNEEVLDILTWSAASLALAVAIALGLIALKHALKRLVRARAKDDG